MDRLLLHRLTRCSVGLLRQQQLATEVGNSTLAVNTGKPLPSEDLANSVNTGAVVIRCLLARLERRGADEVAIRRWLRVAVKSAGCWIDDSSAPVI